MVPPIVVLFLLEVILQKLEFFFFFYKLNEKKTGTVTLNSDWIVNNVEQQCSGLKSVS